MPATGGAKQEKGFIHMNKFSLIFIVLLFITCKDKTGQYSPVPDVPVDVYINTTLPQYQQLNTIGGWAYYPAGNRGLFIYHNSLDEVVAFDRNCTYNVYDSCAIISMNISETFVQCGSYRNTIWIPCCNSKFSLDGLVLGGPARYPLKKYYVTLNGVQMHISSSPL
jgi:Rieske Fe-S protein